MVKKCLNGIIIALLMFSYLNRGLYVDISEGRYSCANHISYTKSEINSILELIFEWKGKGNDIDEDGDSPENYATFHFSKLFICHNFSRTLTENKPIAKDVKKKYYVSSDEMYTQLVYGEIDPPPEG